jgi:nicotinamide-nucleotide amidase
MWFEKDGKVLVSMPGVPFETREMLERSVLPKLLERFPSDVAIEHRTAIITGFTESKLAMTISDWEDALPSYLHLAYLPKPGIIRLRLDGTHTDRNFLVAEINRYHRQLCDMLGDNVLIDSDTPLEEYLLTLLKEKGLTISTAESCTGGYIAHLITSVPGSSEAFNGGVVAYSNAVKQSLLSVSPDTLAAHGAVSEETVREMVIGACKALSTDCAIATSGIAGPSGGTPDKPVGTVCIAVATPAGVITTNNRFPGNRSRVIDRSASNALILAIQQIKKL